MDEASDIDLFSPSIHEELLSPVLTKLGKFSPEEQKQITKAAHFAAHAHIDQKRKSGEPYIIHPVAVALGLLELGMDAQSIMAGFMHDIIEDTPYSQEFIANEFGSEVATLVEGVTKIARLKSQTKSEQEAETIRKMFFAMSKDPRVIIIKLCDKRHNMSTLQFLDPARAREIAYECLDIYAPLADRLGINQLKVVLEDEALKIISPESSKLIEDYINAQKGEQLAFLKTAEETIVKKCEEAGIKGIQISSRIKHNYSIYQKMKRRGKAIDEIFDIYGTRVICSSITECYTILGVIHSIWPPIEGRFKDYIAMPKANSYQSLHTTVVGPRGRILEIQIRTEEMEVTANFGMASHWAYKVQTGREKSSGLLSFLKIKSANKVEDTPENQEDIKRFSSFVGRMQNWKDRIEESETFMNEIKDELLQDTIIVFTPKGRAIELPQGATALDFAYQIHTDIGNQCYQAKADGQMISLSEPLKNTQVIEITTNKNTRPKESWLKYAHTQSARKKIKSWLNKNDEEIIFARNLVVKNIPEAGTNGKEKFKLLKSDDIVKEVNRREEINNAKKSELSISGDNNFMVHFAHCCNPVQGDPIVGYVSRGRGIIVHKSDCPNIKGMPEFRERRIDVKWEVDEPVLIQKFNITSRRTEDIFSEIESAIKKFGSRLIEGRVSDDGASLIGSFTLECRNESQAREIQKTINQIDSVEKVERA